MGESPKQQSTSQTRGNVSKSEGAMKSLLQRFTGLPSLAKWVIAGVLTVLLVLLFIWGKDGISNWNEKRKQAQYDAKQKATDAEIGKLQEGNRQLLLEKKEADAKAEMKTQESDLLKLELAKYGKAARDAVSKQTEAMKNYEEDKARINLDASPFQRCVDLCRERAGIGYPCPRDFCESRR